MFSRPWMFWGLLAAAIAGPYLLMDKQMASGLWKPSHSWFAAAGGGKNAVDLSLDQQLQTHADEVASTSTTIGAANFDGQPVYDITQVFRFDVTPDLVTTHWPRITTVTAETDRQGMRVPLLTGTRPDDLAGSLTYYFDKNRKLQRITFEGVTGDDRRLISYLTSTFGLKSAPSLGAGLFLSYGNGKPLSALRVSHLPVLRNDSPHERLDILLELNRAGRSAHASTRLLELLDQEKQAGAW